MFCLNITWTGDRLRKSKPSRYVTSYPGQLSLAIPLWVGTVTTSKSWEVNRHTTQCTSPVSVIWKCKLVSGWRLRKRKPEIAPFYGLPGPGSTLFFLLLKSIYLSGDLIGFMPGSFGGLLTRRIKVSLADEQHAEDGRTKCAFFK